MKEHKYIGVNGVLDHTLYEYNLKGSKILINGKGMELKQVQNNGDVISTDDEELSQRLVESGLYDEIKSKKVGRPSNTSNNPDEVK